jgi:hypothetical protein
MKDLNKKNKKLEKDQKVSGKINLPEPPFRRLRIYAVDPILSSDIETIDVNEVTINLPWEKLQQGPVDDRLEVIDYDPSSKCFYHPVDLNNPNLLAQDGLPPSEGNPQFHQQMVYAVARTTIKNFEHALGRKALWSSRKTIKNGITVDEENIKKLKLFPHALREPNAYYHSGKKAILFGYLNASLTRYGKNMPGGLVFTCLSHDIIAHETSHALMDGIHPYLIEPSNPDVWAIHESFADIVALFQHFSYPKILEHQIAATKGDLQKQNLLAKLAYQFGQAIGNYGALRDALGSIDKKGKWIPKPIEPNLIETTFEPHERGAILVAAVFDAFLTIYKHRIKDLIRIASDGTGILRPGELHPDLVGRLSKEASKTSQHILNMCIRALDYIPPVDVNYGDFLRAIITADADLISDDKNYYRLAFIESFRKRGIYPLDVRSLSVESLMWKVPNEKEQIAFSKVFPHKTRLTTLLPEWETDTPIKTIQDDIGRSKDILKNWFTHKNNSEAAKAARLVVGKKSIKAFYRDDDGPILDVNSVRPMRRVGPDGKVLTDLLIEFTQSRKGYFDETVQEKADSGKCVDLGGRRIIKKGSTLLVDIKTAKVRYCIYKEINSDIRLIHMREHLLNERRSSRESMSPSIVNDYYHNLTRSMMNSEFVSEEPFSMLNRSYSDRRKP